jgi:hypothetical protein
LWDEENNEEEILQVSEDRMWIIETSLEYNDTKISEFEKFCNTKKWEILNNICSYWELKCSLEDFENNKCN